jgi:hypothetical protein
MLSLRSDDRNENRLAVSDDSSASRVGYPICPYTSVRDGNGGVREPMLK